MKTKGGNVVAFWSRMPPADGAFLMALDAILPRWWDGPLWVRTFEWECPTVSLGARQNPQAVVDLNRCRERGVDIVRRPTGGAAVLHHKELTYSVIGTPAQVQARTMLEVYHAIAHALLAALHYLGICDAEVVTPSERAHRIDGFCFQQTAHYEIAVRGRKLIGNAQRWENRHFLQHGSILIDFESSMSDIFLSGLFRRESFITLQEIIPGITSDDVATAVHYGFEQRIGEDFHSIDLPSHLIDRAMEHREKYLILANSSAASTNHE